MGLVIGEVSVVSPLGLDAAEHVFFLRGEVAPFASGAFTNEEDEPLPIHDCGWIPAVRPWSSRLGLLAKRALARVTPRDRKVPLLLVTSAEALEPEVDLRRFLSFAGHNVASARVGAAAFVAALDDAQELLKREPEVVLLAVDSRIRRDLIEDWFAIRYSAFTRNPLPPSEGAAAIRLTSNGSGGAPVARILGYASQVSEANDDNDLPTDGSALTRVFAELGMPPAVPLVVGPFDADPLRSREFQLASARHAQPLMTAEILSLEGKIGAFGAAGGLMSLAFAVANLQARTLEESSARPVALSWARSSDGTVGGALVEAWS
ncbi:MAG: hypothetical protein U0271_22435 [Polyangiaceae bacterium]